jgi:hypothetical protein
MKAVSRMLSVLALGCFVACGGGGGGDPIADSAKGMVDSTKALSTLKTDMASDSVFASLAKIQQYAQTIQIEKMKQQASQAQSALEQDLGLAHLALEQSCYQVDGTSATYTNCTFSGEGASGTINGSVSVNGDVITIDLIIDIQAQGTTIKVEYDGELTITATSIDGALTIKYDIDISAYTGTGAPAGTPQTVEAEISMDFNDITLDASGCATGGTMVLGGMSAKDITVTFGPACGDVKVE